MSKEKAGKDAAKGKPRLRLPVLEQTSQAKVKELLPPFSRVWGDYYEGRWRANLEGHAGMQERWDDGNRLRAAVILLQRIWRAWLEEEDLEESACWVEGLFQAQPAAVDAAVHPQLQINEEEAAQALPPLEDAGGAAA